MEKTDTKNVLQDTIRDLACCLGRIVARHQVPDDVVWEIAKGFDVIYERARRRIGNESPPPNAHGPVHRALPHPGITYLLEKLEREAAS